MNKETFKDKSRISQTITQNCWNLCVFQSYVVARIQTKAKRPEDKHVQEIYVFVCVRHPYQQCNLMRA